MNNIRNFNRSSYQSTSYAQNNRSESGRGYNSRFEPREKKKHSGCKMTRYYPKTGANAGVEQTIVNGWMCHKGSPMLSFKAVTTSKSSLTEKGWFGSVAVTVINKSDMSKQFYWATMEKATGKVVIQDLGLVMNPKGGYGGVVAFYGKKR